MAVLIGTDEAGYGPNLGPLTVTATAWQVLDSSIDLYDQLAGIVSRTTRADGVAIADSKSLYSSSGSIAALETSVLACLFAMHERLPCNWIQLIEMIGDEQTVSGVRNEDWLEARQLKLPIKADPVSIKELGHRLRQVMSQSRAELTGVSLSSVFPAQFNAGIELHGNKATLLSMTTLRLISQVLSSHKNHDFTEIQIVCDKHGGRSKYAGLLQHCLTDQMIAIRQESLNISEYEWRESKCCYNARFIARGESFLPTALASMISKYVREVFMELWNQFWIQHLPKIRPTKGYPLDAKRFKKEIATMQHELGISDDSIWRIR